MEGLIAIRQRMGLSQRVLAKKAHISYKALQMIESGQHNPEFKTLKKIAVALGYKSRVFQNFVEGFFDADPDSLEATSLQMISQKEWTIPFFDFVDGFRKNPHVAKIEVPPHFHMSEQHKALLASTVEVLCDEKSLPYPWWCQSVNPLSEPWFVADVENLKASALIESPLHFRKRNVFVLENFLNRI